jgi:hypothetical protein
LGAVALALAAAATVIGYTGQAEAPRLVGQNAAINPEAVDPLRLASHNSPTVVRNPVRPENVAEVNRLDRPLFSCALHVSYDGGASWSPTTIPFPAGEEEPPRCFAPDVAFGADGTLYLSFATLKGAGNVPNAIWLTRSTDGGRTLTTPQRRLGPLSFQVRLTADPQRAGRLYLSWLQASDTANFAFPNTGNPIFVARTEDGGATWTDPVRVSPTARARAISPSPAVGPEGQVYLLYLDVRDDRIDYDGGHEGRGGIPDDGPWELVLARSADSGATWRETTVDAGVIPFERFIVFIPPSPSLAVDPESGRVYVAFHDGRHGDADVHLWSSSDGGVTFGPPRRVNDTPTRDGTWQYLPKVAVAPNGRVDVVYYDRRADRGNVLNEVSLQSSTDGGRRFTSRVVLSDRAFDSRLGFGSARDLPDLGSRLGLLSTSSRALAVWADTRSGTRELIKQDVGIAVVEFPAEPPVRSVLRVGGPALGLAALALLGWWATTARGRRGG